MSYDKEQDLQAEIRALIAEDAKKALVDTKPEAIPEESQVQAPSTIATEQVEQYTPKDEWEEKAVKLGWDPNHKAETFVDAKEYVLRKPLFDRIERQSKELRDLKDLQKKNAEFLAAARKESYEQALKDIELRKEQAVGMADTDEYKRLNLQAVGIQSRMQQDPVIQHAQQFQTAPAELPEVSEFKARNGNWYNEDTLENKEMKALAVSADRFLNEQAQIRGYRLNPADHLARVEAEVRSRYPHRFGPVAAPVVSNMEQPASKPVTMSTRSTVSAGTSGVVKENEFVARLNPTQRNLGEQIVKQSIGRDGKPTYSLEQYAKDLDAMGRLK